MEEFQIPKIIHYCWFGGKEKPSNVQRCMQSWNKNLNGYQFIEWNESNFDVNSIPYTKEAYQAGKYAFVSDVARIQGLMKYGGIYMDTDVEVVKDFAPVLNHSCILGFEEKNFIATSFIGCIPGYPLLQQFNHIYQNLSFLDEDGNINTETNVQKLTKMLCMKGLERNNRMQVLKDGITVFPQEYFSPYDYINCYLKKSEDTYCIHHFFVSWMPVTSRIKKKIKKVVVHIIGPLCMDKLRRHFRS